VGHLALAGRRTHSQLHDRHHPNRAGETSYPTSEWILGARDEWQKIPSGKQPYAIGLKRGGLMAGAGR
jgi:hypothetical protein